MKIKTNKRRADFIFHKRRKKNIKTFKNMWMIRVEKEENGNW